MTERTVLNPSPQAGEEMPAALADWLARFNAAKLELEKQGYKRTPTLIREALDTLTRTFVTDRPTVARVVDDLIPGIGYAVPVRVYHPLPGHALPILVYAHGGGHVAGSVSVYDPLARKLADVSGHVVVSVDYRLAPECPYPAGLKDLISVVKGVQQLLTERQLPHRPQISLAGDSAGAALCATASHMLRYEPTIEIASQVLIYPSLDYTLSMPSVQRLVRGYLLERDRIVWYFDQYFQSAENRRDVSPLFMDCSDDLPRTLLVTAQYCPLQEEGIAYADRLRQAGVDIVHLHCDGMIHAFLNLEDLVPESCHFVYQRIRDFLDHETSSGE